MIDLDTLRKAKGYVLAVVDESTGEYKPVRSDVVQVIRCKDCKWWEYYDEGDFGITYGGCRSQRWFHTTSNGLETTGDDYCSWAERKSE